MLFKMSGKLLEVLMYTQHIQLLFSNCKQNNRPCSLLKDVYSTNFCETTDIVKTCPGIGVSSEN